MPQEAAHRDEGLYSHGKPKFSKPRIEPLEVMILGLSRTGTSSLLEAFQTLGYGTIYNSRETLRRHQETFCNAGLDAKYTNSGPKFELEQFESLFGEYRVISGEFVCAYASELIDAYPNAKVILSIRNDEEKWLRSLMETMWYNNTIWATKFLQWTDPTTREKWWEHMFWNDLPSHGIRVYREHNAMVKRKTSPNRLLVYNTSEGWEPLCSFLGKDVPDVTFPHVNRTWEHRALFAGIRRAAIKGIVLRAMKKAGLLALIIGITIWKRARLASALRALRPKSM